ncbi:3'(2'),5'-bisphosphate nucleotidase 1-like isoform X3 [Pomacea canaliculata]|uniref:3'(2'),5'-bisphosphate nucleotidase 1-like isoform X3 n=1 Tax=Pomacea canaliculata TaxID=400727 RepID=UPI000D73AACF|nr:3'(2'),5'-bisphosphate nucleotidase 1-like isoform X3 [Pomacea canaliculata]
MAGTASSPLLMRILAASVSVSNRAAGIIRDIMKSGDLGIVEKAKNDLQTEADRAAQRCIVASLHRQFPKVPIFGEESLDPQDVIPEELIETEMSADVLKHPCPTGFQNLKDDDIVIWVDPLDGTAEYTQALQLNESGLLDHVTVLIGVAVNGVATGGIINQPYHNYQAGPDAKLGRCIWGLVGLGSFGFERQKPPEGENIITTTRSHSNRAVTEAVEACQPSSVLRVGGAGHKVLLLIEGKVHAYVFASKGCKKWDTCSPEAILHAAGGRLTDLLGMPIPYHSQVAFGNSSGVLATVSNHDWYVSQIPQDIREMFQPAPDTPPAKV